MNLMADLLKAQDLGASN